MSQKTAEAAFQMALAMEGRGDLAGASKEFARATDLDGSDARYWISRGRALMKLHHHPEAVRCLRAGIQLGPHYGEADARMFLADALWHSGRTKEAEQRWLRVSRMAPSYPGYDKPIEEAKRRLARRRPS